MAFADPVAQLRSHLANCQLTVCVSCRSKPSKPKSHRIHVWYIYANIGGILMVNVTIYTIHGSYGNGCMSNRILCQSHSMEPSIHQWDFLTFTDSMAIFSDEFLHK